MRLEAEGMVRLEQNKGFRVAAVSRDSLLRSHAVAHRDREHRTAQVD